MVPNIKFLNVYCSKYDNWLLLLIWYIGTIYKMRSDLYS